MKTIKIQISQSAANSIQRKMDLSFIPKFWVGQPWELYPTINPPVEAVEEKGEVCYCGDFGWVKGG